MWDAPWHWVVLAIIVIALFGYKRLPDAARSLGRSLRIFKTEMKGLSQDDAARNEAAVGEPKAVTAAPPAETVPNPAAAPPAATAPAASAPAASAPAAAQVAAPVAAPPAPAPPVSDSAPISDPTAPPQA